MARPRDVVGLGITNQRETTIVWDRETGKAVYNAIVWQDSRTAAQMKKLADDGARLTWLGTYEVPYVDSNLYLVDLAKRN